MPKHTKLSHTDGAQARSNGLIPLLGRLSVPAGVGLLCAATLLAYLPSIDGGFLTDDDYLLTKNALVKAPDGLYQIWCTTEDIDYWPITNSTFAVEWRLWAMNPAGYHAFNLILHILEALLVWIILRNLSVRGAFLAAIIFALHPVNVESVAWIASRKNLMAMLFFLLSILWYFKFLKLKQIAPVYESAFVARWDTGRQIAHRRSFTLHPSPFRTWYWTSLSAFVLAMLSKGSVAILPVLLLAITWWLHRCDGAGAIHSGQRGLFSARWRRNALLTAPFFALAAVLAAVNIWFQTHGSGQVYREASPMHRVLDAGCVIWFYLYKAFVPIDLATVYPQWQTETGNILWWLPLAGALGVTIVLWRYRGGWAGPFLLAWGFFCTALVPVMGFTDVGYMQYALVADRYQHIAIIAVIALAASGFTIWRRTAGAAWQWAAAAGAAAALAFLTWQQSQIYRDPVALYRFTLEKNPDCWMAYDNLGIQLADAGQWNEAIAQYEQALRLKSDDSATHNNMGLALLNTGRRTEAIKHLRYALRLRPEYPEAWNNLGNALAQSGESDEAIKSYQKALELNPRYVKAYYNLGAALAQRGRTQEAIDRFREALRINPDIAEIHNHLGALLMETGQFETAIEHYRHALRVKGDFTDARYNLGNAYLAVGQYPQAAEQYEYVLRLNSNDAEAHFNLANALGHSGKPERAVEHYRQAIRLKPDFAAAYYSLALAYADLRQSSAAVAAGQKALELSRSQKQPELTKQIGDWLDSYRAQVSK
jgi:tetratricopeptide (TPR) repeat protein